MGLSPLNSDLLPAWFRDTVVADLGDRSLLQWWFDGLKVCLPGSLRSHSPEKLKTLVQLGEKQAEVYLQGGEQMTRTGELLLDQPGSLGVIEGSAHPITLELPETSVLVRKVYFPMEVEKSIRDVLGYEMDRLTPFSGTDTYFDYQVTSRDRQNKKIELELAVVRQDVLRPWLDFFKMNGYSVVRVSSARLWSGACLLPDSFKPVRKSSSRILQAALVLLIMLMFAATLIGPVWKKKQEMDAVEKVLSSVRLEAEEVVTLTEELEARKQSSGYVLDQRRKYIPTIDILNELTSRLPEDTWVMQLEIRDNKVEIRGESEFATRLIGILEDSPLFRSVFFRSPVVQLQKDNVERYHISMELNTAQEVGE